MATKGTLIIVVANETEELNTIDKTRSRMKLEGDIYSLIKNDQNNAICLL